MLHRATTFITGLALILVSAGALAQPGAAPLGVGSPAPALTVGKWIKGDPVDGFAAGQVYVVEFWATWCGPCKRVIPRLTQTQAHYAGKVTVIAVDIWENNPDGVEPFVKEMGDAINFSVATDQVPSGQRQGTMAKAWMRASEQHAIPLAFIVDKEGKIAWIGNPMSMSRPLAEVVAGTFDPTREAEIAGKSSALESEQRDAFKAKEFDKVMELADKIVEQDPSMAPVQSMLKVRALYGKQDWAGGDALATNLMNQYAKQPDTLRSLSWTIINAGGNANVQLALAAAVKAQQQSDGGWAGRSLLARACFVNADFKRAAEIQEQVVAAVDGPMKEYQQKLLDAYKEAASK